MHIFDVLLGRERGKSGEIGEHYRHLFAFPHEKARGIGGFRWSCGGRRADRFAASRAELCRRRKVATAVGAPSQQRRAAVLAEPRVPRIFRATRLAKHILAA